MKHQMDFFDSQDRARRNTLRLAIVYPLIVAAIVVLVYVVVITVGSFFVKDDRKPLVDHIWNPQLFAWVAGVTLAIIIIGNIYKIVQLSSGGPGIALMLGGHLITPGQCRSSERVVLNVVEEMAIASGTPVPPVYVLDEEEAINAFAAGYRPADAVIAVSGGAVQYLSRLELQGVVAHEFSHILNGDMRLNMRLVGILHGILMLSYLGEGCLRLAYELARGAGQATKETEGEYAGFATAFVWTVPLVMLGGGLQIIGFVGVLFGSWIKSGVSKQREFLADASAVQFTRNPDGIGEALKKIGGLARGSKLRARRAAQFSHMFFSAATEASLIDLFATHPPLEERIRRIDPNWDGAFPDGVAPVGLPVVELKSAEYASQATPKASRKPSKQTVALVQPLQTAGLLAGGPLLQPAPRIGEGAGEEAAALNVEDTLQQIGAPGPEHLAYAAALLAQLSPPLRSAIDEPFGAQAVVLLLLLDENDPIREKQLQYLRERFDPGQMKQIEALMPVVREVPVEARLPLVEIAASALRLLSEPQYRQYRELVQKLVDADAKVDYFEFALLRSLERHLAAHFNPKRPPILKYTAIQPLLPACSMLLSTLAHVGTDDDQQAKKAFYEAELVLTSEGGLRLHDRRDTGVRRVDIALEELAQAVPAIKRKLLAACTTCIAYDGKVTIEEGELLRAIADSLDCPLPPLLISQKIEAKT
jgi:Zn-dependent protease with chaperone function